MVVQRVTPSEYFENKLPLQTPPLQTNGTNHTPLIIFGGICVVAIVAIAIVCSKK